VRVPSNAPVKLLVQAVADLDGCENLFILGYCESEQDTGYMYHLSLSAYFHMPVCDVLEKNDIPSGTEGV